MSKPKTFTKHLVTFMSPGTMYDEYTTKEISAWDPALAMGLAETVVERYGARPYAFQFSTQICAEPVPDGHGGTLRVEPKTTAESGRYYIKGTLLTYDDVVARGLNNDKQREDDWSLRNNMSSPDSCIACVTTNSFKHHGRFNERDFVVDAAGSIIERGDDLRWAAVRQARAAAAEVAEAAAKAEYEARAQARAHAQAQEEEPTP